MEVHPQFRLNGVSLDHETLYEVAYSWVKEGKDFEIDAGDFLLDWLSPSQSIQVKTSGSTGTPKTIELSKEKMMNSALATGNHFELAPKDTALLCLSTKHIAGKMMLVRAMVLGMWIEVIEPSSNPMESCTGSYDFVAMVPMQVQNSLPQLYQIKKLIIGGAPISKSLRESLKTQENAIFETYGMTETITHIAVKRISGLMGQEAEGHFEILPDVDISQDDRGCLVIYAPQIVDGAVITNDLVDLVDKRRFKWLGRYDNIINSGGVKLIPEEIEEKLAPTIPHRFFVAGIPDQVLGEKLVLYIEGQLDVDHLKLRIDHLKELGKFERPRHIYKIEKFVETGSGKINRSRTVALHSSS